MTKRSDISVFINVKGISPTVGNTIHGFLNQSVLPLEILVIGDRASIKNTQQLLAESEKTRVKWISFSGDKNDARNKGFECSRGQFVFFVDHDMIPSSTLIAESDSLVLTHDVLIIPEVGKSQGNLLERIFSLEKKLVMEDPAALTPRLFRRSYFNSKQLPFDSRFGVLDEWGFYIKLKKNNPRIAVTKSIVTVIDNDSIFSRLIKNFKKGQSIHHLAKTDSDEAIRRVNPLTRGVFFYGRRLSRIFSQPIEFVGLVCVKFLDLTSFTLGYLKGFT